MAFQYLVVFVLGIIFTLVALFLGIYEALLKVDSKFSSKREQLVDANKAWNEERKEKKVQRVMASKLQMAADSEDRKEQQEPKVGDYGIPINPIFDPNSTTIVEGKLMVQFGGKKATLQERYCYLKNAVFYHMPKKGTAPNKVNSLCFDGCVLRKAETEVRFKNAIEVLNPKRPLVYPPRCDYVYLVAKNEKEMQRWYFGLLSAGCKPAAGSMSSPVLIPSNEKLSHNDDSPTFDSLLGSANRNSAELQRKGWLQVQKEAHKGAVVKRFCVLNGRKLLMYESEKVLSCDAEEVDLSHCLIKAPDRDRKLKFAFEIHHLEKEVAPGIDFLTLIFDSESAKELWRLAISAGCLPQQQQQQQQQQSSSSSSASSSVYVAPRASGIFSEPSLLNGNNNAPLSLTTAHPSVSVPAVQLTGIPSASLVAPTPNLLHASASTPQVSAVLHRSTSPLSNNPSTVGSSAGNFRSSVSVPQTQHSTLIEALSAVPPADNPTHKRNRESAEWLNAILARFFENIRLNSVVIASLKEKFMKKMLQKVQEKKLDGYLDEITVTELDIGTVTPRIIATKLLEASSPGEVAVDIHLEYNGRARARISAKILLSSWLNTVITVEADVSLLHLSGKLHLNIPPFPAERFSICFYDEPKTEFEVQTNVNDRKWLNSIPQIQDLIIKKFRLSILERLVAPNRRYMRVPKSAATEELLRGVAIVAAATSSSAQPTPTNPTNSTSGNGSAAAASASAASVSSVGPVLPSAPSVASPVPSATSVLTPLTSNLNVATSSNPTPTSSSASSNSSNATPQLTPVTVVGRSTSSGSVSQAAALEKSASPPRVNNSHSNGHPLRSSSSSLLPTAAPPPSFPPPASAPILTADAALKTLNISSTEFSPTASHHAPSSLSISSDAIVAPSSTTPSGGTASAPNLQPTPAKKGLLARLKDNVNARRHSSPPGTTTLKNNSNPQEAELFLAKHCARLWFDKFAYKKHLSRKRALLMLAQSETVYCTTLRALTNVPTMPIFGELGSVVELQSMFADLLNPILAYHQKIAEELDRRASHWQVESRVGDVLHELATFLKDQEGKFHEKYRYFCSHTLDQWKKHQPKLLSLFQTIKVPDGGQEVLLEELLHRPVIRLSKYVTLVEMICRSTLSSHADKWNLDTALERLRHIESDMVLGKGLKEKVLKSVLSKFGK